MPAFAATWSEIYNLFLIQFRYLRSETHTHRQTHNLKKNVNLLQRSFFYNFFLPKQHRVIVAVAAFRLGIPIFFYVGIHIQTNTCISLDRVSSWRRCCSSSSNNNSHNVYYSRWCTPASLCTEWRKKRQNHAVLQNIKRHLKLNRIPPTTTREHYTKIHYMYMCNIQPIL